MTEALLSAARSHWGLDAVPPQLIAARENSVYRVALGGVPMALRLHRPGYRTAQELRSELQWMAMLAKNGLPVPEPVPARAGSEILVQDGVVVDLLSWVTGTPMSAAPPRSQDYIALGRIMAQMHTLADAWNPPEGFARPQWDLVGPDPLWDRFWDNPHLTQDQRQEFKAFRSFARGQLAAMDTADWGLIHADLVPDNVLIDGDSVVPIDFDDGGFGHRLFDVATVTFRSRRDDPTGALAKATLEGYAQIRTIDAKPLPLFEALRACTYVGWNITRITEADGPARNARFIAAAEHSIAQVLP